MSESQLNTIVALSTPFSTWAQLGSEIEAGYIPDLFLGNPYHCVLARLLGML